MCKNATFILIITCDILRRNNRVNEYMGEWIDE